MGGVRLAVKWWELSALAQDDTAPLVPICKKIGEWHERRGKLGFAARSVKKGKWERIDRAATNKRPPTALFINSRV